MMPVNGRWDLNRRLKVKTLLIQIQKCRRYAGFVKFHLVALEQDSFENFYSRIFLESVRLPRNVILRYCRFLNLGIFLFFLLFFGMWQV